MSLVWDRSQHTGSHLLMMLALADHADDDGTCYPSVAGLAEKCRMGVRNANIVLAALRDSGEIEVRFNAGPKGKNLYRILLKALGRLQSVSGVQSPSGVQRVSGAETGFTLQCHAGTPETAFPKPLKPVSAEPSLNRQEPSSKARRMRPARLAPVADTLPNWVPADTWADFVAMRKSIRKPMTAAAVALQLRTLDKLRADGHDPRAVLEQSIAASWQGLFPIKADTRSSAVLSSDEIFANVR